jgi:hypothetical protein
MPLKLTKSTPGDADDDLLFFLLTLVPPLSSSSVPLFLLLSFHLTVVFCEIYTAADGFLFNNTLLGVLFGSHCTHTTPGDTREDVSAGIPSPHTSHLHL